MTKKITIIFTFFIFCSNMFSNPMPVGGNGKTIVPYLYESTNIKLKSEFIKITVGDTYSIDSFVPNEKLIIKSISYNCNYQFENKGDKVKILIGFPFYRGDTLAGSSYGSIHGFKVFINRIEVKNIKQKSIQIKNIILLKKDIKDQIDDKLIKKLIKLKYIFEIEGQPDMYDVTNLGTNSDKRLEILNSIKYDKKQLFKLNNIIEMNISSIDHSFQVYQHWFYFPVTFEAKSSNKLIIKYHSLNGNLENRSFYYVLKSGKFWKDKIDNCTVNVEFLEPKDIKKFKIYPENYIRKDNSIIFEWNHFIPKQDIYFEYIK